MVHQYILQMSKLSETFMSMTLNSAGKNLNVIQRWENRKKTHFDFAVSASIRLYFSHMSKKNSRFHLKFKSAEG